MSCHDYEGVMLVLCNEIRIIWCKRLTWLHSQTPPESKIICVLLSSACFEDQLIHDVGKTAILAWLQQFQFLLLIFLHQFPRKWRFCSLEHMGWKQCSDLCNIPILHISLIGNIANGVLPLLYPLPGNNS